MDTRFRTDRQLRAYREGVAQDRIPSLRDLGLPVGPRTRLGFAPGTGDDQAAQDTAARLLALWAVMERRTRSLTDDEEKLVELGADFLVAVTYGDTARVQELLDAGFPADYQDPRTGESALHIAASKKALNALTISLLDSGACDLLLEDFYGRLAWNHAAFFNPDSEAILERLGRETRAAADADGIDLIAEQLRRHREWFEQDWFQRLRNYSEYIPD